MSSRVLRRRCVAGIALTAAVALAAGVAVGAGVAPAAAAPAPGVVRDDLQRDVRFAQPPRRIITLLPSLTETVCALGACDRLVATDRFSNWPAQVEDLPKVGTLDETSVEAIVSLRPDVILLSHSQRITQRLQDLGIPSFVVNTQSYADIARTARLLGAVLGTPDAATVLIRRLDAAVDAIGARARAQRQGRTPSVYYEVDRGPYAAGPDSFIGELLRRLGTRNIVTPDLGPFPKLNPEYVVRHDPDVIFALPGEVQHLAERPGWATLHAVAGRHLCSFPSEVGDTIVRPGPRVPEGMRALEECLERVAP